MRKNLLMIFIGLAILLPISKSHGETALGFIIGEPTGVSLRVDHFPILGISWSLREDWMSIHGDYWILHKQFPGNPLYWYLGAGGRFVVWNSDFVVGARIPIGLQFKFERNWELFGELAPVINLIPDVDGEVNGGIGLRYIF